jgi:hypothetical protein
LLAMISLRVAMNDGVFIEQRRMPTRQPSKELRAAIVRPWKRGSRPDPQIRAKPQATSWERI